MTSEEIAWDLSRLFKGPKDPRIDQTMADCQKRAVEFAKAYSPAMATNDVDAELLLKILRDYESLLIDAMEVGQYCGLSYAANQNLPETKDLSNKSRKFSSELQSTVAFFDVQLGQLLLNKPQLMTDPKLAAYLRYLEKSARGAPHRLSEAEEKLAIALNRHGVQAWQQFQSSFLGTKVFRITVDGEEKELGFGGAIGLFDHADKQVRKEAHEVVFGTLQEHAGTFSNCLRNITGNHVVISNIRGYDDPVHSSLIANDIERPMFDSLAETIDKHKTQFQRFLRLKAKMMGCDKLAAEDVSAPVPGLPELTYTWNEATAIVKESSRLFDDEFGDIVATMIDENQIDASLRKGKRQGAFCSGWPKGKSAFVLLSFADTLSSVFTLAHELGHGIHSTLTERQETPLQQNYTSVVAEVASMFGEILLTELLLKKVKNDEEKKAVLLNVLDGMGQSIFQVFSRTWFELATYDAFKKGEFLDEKAFARLWAESRNKMHGDTVEWFEAMDYDMWTWKPHPYMPSFRFYNFPYVWSQLMVLTLYELYQQDSEGFPPKFKAMLAAGGSKSPAQMAADMGFDLNASDFWEKGMMQYKKLIDQLEALL